MAWTTPRTWVTGETVTAAHMNAHVRDNFNDVAFNGHHVMGRAQDTTGSGISTTEAVEMTANLSIPASWSGYDVEAIVTLELFESGALTADRLVTCRLRLTNAAGTEIGLTNHTLDTLPAAGFRNPVAVAGYVTGQTATGTLPIVFTAQIAGDSGQASWDNGTLLAYAYRTS